MYTHTLKEEKLHSHKILMIQQGEPCCLSIWPNPCRLQWVVKRNVKQVGEVFHVQTPRVKPC